MSEKTLEQRRIEIDIKRCDSEIEAVLHEVDEAGDWKAKKVLGFPLPYLREQRARLLASLNGEAGHE